MATNLALANDAAHLNGQKAAASLQVFSTCPSSVTAPDDYVRKIGDVARWSEAAGCSGILVYTDNSLVDPWLVSQVIVQNTHSLCPLVAVQPVYMHPYAVAKMVSTLAFLHGRRVFLNMVAGGFKNGKQEGLWKRYGENGVLCDAGKYVDGKKAGVWKYYDPGGKLRRPKTY